MEGKGKINLPGTKEEVFEEMLNPELLEKCIMGCKEFNVIEDNKYKAELSVGIAAVKGKYDADIEVKNITEGDSYTLVIHGEGNPGLVDAVADIKLEQIDDNETLVKYEYEADAGGKIASIGQRMLGGVAKLVINDFFKKAKNELKKKQEAA
ncbi:SRPBCC family protein [Salinicoccus sp. HZC-1]|uniref:SRPBCC family protein n=1 Tax=Salinicoccus sp. HZC-1 TaxID=3385497 RepID=UPI00398BA923